MKNVLSLKEMGISIPLVTKKIETVEEVEQEIKDLEEKLADEIKKIIAYCRTKANFPKEKIVKFQNDFFANDFFTKSEEVSDEKKWAELDNEWWRLNKKFFKLQVKLQKTGCDEYDLNYTGQSEFYQFLHENPDKKRERLENPIREEIEAVETRTHQIEKEQEKLTEYTVQIDSEKIKDNFQLFYKNLLSLN